MVLREREHWTAHHRRSSHYAIGWCVVLDRYEKDFTYESFADTLVRDLDLPEAFRKRLITQIEAQVEKGKRSMPWHEAVETSESLHPIFINIRINDTILIDRFEVRRAVRTSCLVLNTCDGSNDDD